MTAPSLHRLVETITTGPGEHPHMPVANPRYPHNEQDSLKWVLSNEQGMITRCQHGTVYREGWPSLHLGLTGDRLVLVVQQYKPNSIHYSSLPAQCADCANQETRTI